MIKVISKLHLAAARRKVILKILTFDKYPDGVVLPDQVTTRQEFWSDCFFGSQDFTNHIA